MKRPILYAMTAMLAGCAGPAARPEAPVPSKRPDAAVFTSFAEPCPGAGERPKVTPGSTLDTSISLITDCGYADRLTSTSTINRPGNPRGAPDVVTGQLYADLRAEAATKVDRPGIGDEAFLVISYDENETRLVVRSANVLIQVSAGVDGDGDHDRELAALRAKEPQVTALARAMLAELR
jgi:hypothetical protein